MPKAISTTTDDSTAKKKPFSVYMEPPLLKRFRLECVERDITMTDAISEAVGLWLQQRPKK